MDNKKTKQKTPQVEEKAFKPKSAKEKIPLLQEESLSRNWLI